jgi:N-acetylgalactosamine-N,N'-diacetylbacillosaminyl-diphospho-undecaprenol 4-alpha-N-acetylgalactosaminyltransferase
LQTLAHECGLDERVLFAGYIANPYPLVRRAELYVMSSNSEGFPNALVEALALGVPAIATNCNSGPSEILAGAPRSAIEGLTFAPYGVLVPPNEIEPMAEAIKALCDPQRSGAYAAVGAKRAGEFGAAAAKDRYWEVIRDAIDADVRLRAA